ncbi:ATP-binding domain-containing protein [Streptomyces humidus]|uniref:ATP-binding domain-containing protein n=1 Tax=Streptomyces humidus TaxID=52259 RepID=UPI003570D86D
MHAHPARTKRSRSESGWRLTAHQSKGREWNTVAVRLSPADAAALAHGLDPARSDHRALYVALTRARLNTLALT